MSSYMIMLKCVKETIIMDEPKKKDNYYVVSFIYGLLLTLYISYVIHVLICCLNLCIILI